MTSSWWTIGDSTGFSRENGRPEEAERHSGESSRRYRTPGNVVRSPVGPRELRFEDRGAYMAASAASNHDKGGRFEAGSSTMRLNRLLSGGAVAATLLIVN